MTADSLLNLLDHAEIDPNSNPAQLLATLRNIRNSVIGSRTRKSNLASKGLLPYFSALLIFPLPAQFSNHHKDETKGKARDSWNLDDSLEIRGLAATILGSVAHGATPPTLLALLRSRVPSALLQSLEDLSRLSRQSSDLSSNSSSSSTSTSNPTSTSTFTSIPTPTSSTSDSPLIANPSYLKLLESLLRAQRSLLLAVSDEVTPNNRWGIGTGWVSGIGADLMTKNSGSTSTSSNVNTSSSSIMLSGRSSREKHGWEVADSNARMGDCDSDFTEESCRGKYSWDVSGDHPILVSNPHQISKGDSNDQLPDPKASLDHPLDPYSELVHNSRITMTKVFSFKFLPLLLGALFILDTPMGDNKNLQKSIQDSNSNGIGLSRPITPVGGEGNSAIGRARSSAQPPENGRSSSSDIKTDGNFPYQRKAATSSLSRSSSRMSLDVNPREENPENPPETEISSLPLTTRSRILSITEIVCAILSRCVGVTGIGPFNLKGIKDDSEEGVMRFRNIDSPAKELEVRKERILTFKSKDSPWKKRKRGDSGREEEGRGRTFASKGTESLDVEMNTSNPDPNAHLQATLLRSSRSTSRSTSRPNTKSQDVEMAETAQPSLATLEELREGTEENSEIILENKGVLEVLLGAIECGFGKTQEAALWALSELIRENPNSGIRLFRLQTSSGLLPTSMLLNFRKEPSASLRLAAFSCLTHIIKLHPFTPRTNNFVLHALIELLDHPGDVQVQATFAIARLVSDDSDLQLIACESYDVIKKLAGLLEKSSIVTTPGYGSGGRVGSGGFTDRVTVPVDEGLVRLREGTLMTLAALIDTREDLIHQLVDYNKPALLPMIIPSLTASSLGIRISAAKVIKCLSRSVRILRTSLVDSGVAEKLLQMLKNKHEHHQVKIQAMDALSNLVMKFSPMKQYLLEHGAIEKLTQIAKGEIDDESGNYLHAVGIGRKSKNQSESQVPKPKVIDGNARFASLWVLKNLIHGSDTQLKKRVMEQLGWEYVAFLAFPSETSNPSSEQVEQQHLQDNDVQSQAQALEIIGNLCSSREEDVELTLQNLKRESLMDSLESVIWQESDETVLLAVASVLINIATGSDEHRKLILDRPNLLDAILYFMKHPKPKLRAAGCWIALNLTYQAPDSSSNSAPSFSAWLPSPSPPPPAPSLQSSSSTTVPGDAMGSKPSQSASVPIQEIALDRMKAFGFEAQVRQLAMDEALDVRDRARALLSRFE